MAHSFTEKELIDALMSKGAYVVTPSKSGLLPSPPTTFVDMTGSGAPPSARGPPPSARGPPPARSVPPPPKGVPHPAKGGKPSVKGATSTPKGVPSLFSGAPPPSTGVAPPPKGTTTGPPPMFDPYGGARARTAPPKPFVLPPDPSHGPLETPDIKPDPAKVPFYYLETPDTKVNPFRLKGPILPGGRTGVDTSTPKIPPVPDDTFQYRVAPASFPKIPFFSGDDLKNDVPYKEWRYEIRCLMRDSDISQSVLLESIRRSLRGTAKTLLVTLGENVTADSIFYKLENTFGDVSTDSMVMQEFFNEHQRPDESVTSFGCRLESLIQMAIDHGTWDCRSKNDMLKHKFWNSLASDKLKSQTRHKFDSISDYNDLLREIRIVEHEIKVSSQPSSSSRKATAQPVVADSQYADLEKKFDSRFASLEKSLDSKIDDKFSKIMQKLDGFSSNSYSQGPSYNRGNDNNNRFGRRNQGRNYRSNRGRGGRYPNQGKRPEQGQEPLNF